MIEELLNKGLVTQAFETLRHYSSEFPGEGYGDRLDSLQTEFRYMSDFMLQGYKDEGRAQLFADLMDRLKALDYDIKVRKTLLENPYIKQEIKRLRTIDNSVPAVKQMLSDTAGTPEHYNALADAFMVLLISGHWKQEAAEEWAAFLSSPDTDSFDAATLVAAITLSAYCVFSIQKAGCLVKVYRNATAERVRQRAFVGFFLSAMTAPAYYQSDIAALYKHVFETTTAADELLEMQVQMLACAKAEAEGREIQKKIMPDIMRGQSLRFTKNGFEEHEEESDCLNPDADEKRMEAMSDSVNKMLEMQKNGSDIFFTGFSQMKRFPFFYKIPNWFMPFSIDHPDISKAAEPLKGHGFIDMITEKGPFCESDKYSFVIAVSDVIGHLPENIRKMMENGEIGPIGMNTEVLPTASAIRLQYLQDLYRYFKLNQWGSMLDNPFAAGIEGKGDYRLCVMACDYLSDSTRKNICAIMQHDTTASPTDVERVLQSFEDKESFGYLSCYAPHLMKRKDYAGAMDAYAKCLKLKPQQSAMLRGMARACYQNGEYAKAAFYYDALHTLFPKRISYALNYFMAMVMDGMAESVINDIYKLEYETPDDITIKNTLGWVLLNAGKAEQALAVYEKLITSDKANKDFEILLNAFYALLVNGRVQQAIDIMRQYAQTLDEKERRNLAERLGHAMQDDDVLLRRYSFGEAEKAIILSQLAFFAS